MTLRVVLYAEGRREIGLPPTPGSSLGAADQGPGHVLLARCIAHVSKIPITAVRYEGPLRTFRGQVPRGSALHEGRVLRQLLTWPRAERRPDLAVIMIDGDSDSSRYRRLLAELSDLPVPHVLAVAEPEIEGWLAADCELIRVATKTTAQPVNVDKLAPGESKQRLKNLAAICDMSDLELRTLLATDSALDSLAGFSDSFARFLKDLKASLS